MLTWTSRRWLAVFAASGVLVAGLGSSPAFADGRLECDASGLICHTVSDSEGADGNEGDDGGGTDGTPTSDGSGSTDVPRCSGTTSGGVEFEGGYAGKASPQPPANDPVWGSHKPGDGAIYICETRRYNNSFLETLTGFYWAADAPDAQPPDPAVLAQQAIDNLQFEPAQITTTLSDPGDIGYIGIPVFLWIQNPGQGTAPGTGGIDTLRASAAAGGNNQWRVTAEATLDRFEWDMGDDNTVPCNGPGEPYHEGMQDSGCSHIYETQGTHTITVRAHYRIHWSGIGEEDVIDHELPPQTTQITVGENQALNQ